MSVVLVHGGVETSCQPPYLAALRKAALKGYQYLDISLIDAVEKAVMVLEDDPKFNAGYGSVLNLDGEVEMDASVMDGTTGSCGAVACMKNVKNPICVARRIMENTPHVILAGEGAQRFAREERFAPFDPVTSTQRGAWKKLLKMRSREEQLPFSPFTGLPKACDTVGCVVAQDGRTAAGSSTGGALLKLPGRVGDTPVIGGGIYASPHGAVVCTGLGEVFIKLHLAGWTLNIVSRGAPVEEAARAAIERVTELKAPGGILVVDKEGNAAAAYNADQFPVALVVDGKAVKDFKPVKV